MESVLTKAIRLARKKKYVLAEQLLESEVLRYRESFNFFYTLGLCYLYSGNIGTAYDHLLRARELKLRNADVLLALGAIYIKRTDTRSAVRYYLEVQGLDPKNKTADQALKLLKKHSASDELIALVESGKTKSLYPKFPKAPINKKNLFAGILIVVSALVLATGILVQTKTINFEAQQKEKRQGTKESTLSANDKNKPAELGGVYTYILGEKEILDTYNRALSLFNLSNDNAVRPLLNKIYLSNASESIKRKANVLQSYLKVPSFDELVPSGRQTNYTYNDVSKELALYKNVFILWTGMATNIQANQNSTVFDFLIGYEKRNTLIGTVKVVLPFAAEINVETPIEVLGKIINGDDNTFSIEGAVVHQYPLTKGHL
ncbi:MAG: hypothetical protein Ta2B_27080 [Termitinemataceae bacterium]|nr:MAG: hypothetical protein Ta2B_27080 [Termitinemataceae bacterium]